jgi:HEAT repeat protein
MTRNHSRRVLFIGVAVLLLILVVVVVDSLTHREPEHQGRTATQWFAELESQGFNSAPWHHDNPAAEAIHQLGADAVPFLGQSMEHRSSFAARAYSNVWSRLPGRLTSKLPKPRHPQLVRSQSSKLLAEMCAQGAVGDRRFELALAPAVRILNGPPEGNLNALSIVKSLAIRHKLPAAQEALVELLDSPMPARSHVATAIGDAPELFPNTGARLLAVLDDPDPALQIDAAWALFRVTGETNKSVAALMQALDGTNWNHLGNAAHRIGQIGPPAIAAVPALTRLAEHTNAYPREQATLALRKIDPVNHPEPQLDLDGLIQRLLTGEGGERFDAAMRIRAFGTAAHPALPALWTTLTDPQSQHGWVYAETIWLIDPSQQHTLAPHLVQGMQRDDLNPHSWAGLMGRMKADTPEVRTTLKAALDNPNQWLRQAAAFALLNLGQLEPALDERCWDVLTGFLQSKHDLHLRRMSALYAGWLGGVAHRTLPELESLLKDPDQFVRSEASNAIQKISQSREQTDAP